MTTLHINGRAQQVDLPDETPLLWALRDELGHTGTKFGCGMALCGSCTVHVDGQATRSCTLPIGTANLFAFNLGLRTRDPRLMVDRALFGSPATVDVGWASWRNVDAHGAGPATPEQPFLVMAGLGHDAATVLATDSSYLLGPTPSGRLAW